MADEKTKWLNQMWFHPVTGAYIVVNIAAEIPEGFIKDFSECKNPFVDKQGQPPRCVDFHVLDAVEPKPKKAAQAPEGPTLEELELTRAEAKKILKGDGVKFNSRATDREIAAMVADLL